MILLIGVAYAFYSCYGCTDHGEILIKNANGLVSFDPENHQNIFAIEDARWADYTANSMESLVLLDGGNSVSEYKEYFVEFSER